MKYTFLFINSFYTDSIWSEKACQVLHVKVTLAQGSTVKVNSLLCLLKNRNREAREAHGQHKLSYLQLKDTKPSGNLEYCFSGCLAFSQGQIPTHTGTVWPETFAPVPWSFLTRQDADSHRQGPIAGSDIWQYNLM
jgi:hypothetical protein